VYPAAGSLDKAKGRMLEKPFGPATSWHLTFSASGATVIVTTAQGSYEVCFFCCCCGLQAAEVVCTYLSPSCFHNQPMIHSISLAPSGSLARCQS
jgi:hypothetical protein